MVIDHTLLVSHIYWLPLAVQVRKFLGDCLKKYTKSIKRIDHCVSGIMNLLLVNTNRYRYYLQRPAPLLSNNRINYTMKEHRQIMIHWYVNWPTDKHTDVALRLCCLHSVNISWVVIFGYNFRVYLRAHRSTQRDFFRHEIHRLLFVRRQMSLCLYFVNQFTTR